MLYMFGKLSSCRFLILSVNGVFTINWHGAESEPGVILRLFINFQDLSLMILIKRILMKKNCESHYRQTDQHERVIEELSLLKSV